MKESAYSTYLLSEVFTGMSVLPLVFPTSLSCLPGGSYAEELARRRELPVPPMPRRGGVLAKSENNLTIVASYSPLLPRHSSLIWHTQGGEVGSLLGKEIVSDTEVEETKEDIVAEGDHGQDDIVGTGDQQDNISDKANISQIDDSENQTDYSDSNNNDEKVSEEEKNVIKDISKINKFKKVEKHSLIRSALERLSLRSKRRKDKNEKVKDVTIKMPKNDEETPKDEIHNESDKDCPQEDKEEVDIVSIKAKESSPTSTMSTPAPTSSTYIQSRPITHLEAALKDFQMSTAKSRESLSMPISEKSSLLLRRTEPRQSREVNTTTKCWKQKPPPVNNYLENTWRTLSNSMMDIHRRGEETPWQETDLTKTSSHKNLDTVVQEEKEDRLTKTQSLQALGSDSWSARNTQYQNPSNQLMQMNQYQRRVQVSLEKLSVPSWYRSSATPRLRQSGLSSSCSPWRSQTSDSLSSGISFRKEINSAWLSNKNSRTSYRGGSSFTRSTSSSSITSTLSRQQGYLGWRLQERVSTIIRSPAERLASSVTNTTTTEESIKNVTVAIIEYCNNTFGDTHDDKDGDDANIDTDSGISRSMDFPQEASSTDN